MASRSAAQLRHAVPVAVAAWGTIMVLPRRTAFAESPPTGSNRKPIYESLSEPSSTSDPTLPSSKSEIHKPVEPPPPTLTERLTPEIGSVRLAIYKQFLSAEQSFNRFLSSALAREASLANTIASLAPPPESSEKVLPGAVYVLIATMAGTIITRNRGIFLRATFPLAVGVGAGWALIPYTMRNVGDLMWEGEKMAPPIAEGHMFVRGFVTEAVEQTKIHTKVARDWANRTSGDARETIEGWVKGK